MSPEDLWHYCEGEAGIGRQAYDAYFDGTSVALGLCLANVQKIEPIDIHRLRDTFEGFHPPQVMVRLSQQRQSSLSNLLGAM